MTCFMLTETENLNSVKLFFESLAIDLGHYKKTLIDWLTSLCGFCVQDMNEPSNFVTGSTLGCTSGKLDNPPYDAS